MHALFTKTFYPTDIGWRPGEVQYWILKRKCVPQFCEKVDNGGSKICELPLKQVFSQAAPESASEPISKYLKKLYRSLLKWNSHSHCRMKLGVWFSWLSSKSRLEFSSLSNTAQ